MFQVQAELTGVARSRIASAISVAVYDDYRTLIKTKAPSRAQLPIAFIDVGEVDQSNILLADDNETRSGLRVIQNSYLARRSIRKTTRQFFLPIGDAVITDVMSVEGEGGTSEPLYYRHDFVDGITGSFRIFNRLREEVPSGQYRLLIEDGVSVVFHNLLSSYDESNRRLEQYTVEYTDASNRGRSQLLSAMPAYSPANIIDGVNLSKRTYSVRMTATMYRYDIWRNGAGPFYIRSQDYHQIKLKRPRLIKRGTAWNAEITNGQITASVDNAYYHYKVNEFQWQSFSTVAPMQLFKEEATVVGPRTVVVPSSNLIAPGPGTPIDVIVLRSDGRVRYAWSSDDVIPARKWVESIQVRDISAIVDSDLVYSYEISVEPRSGLIRLPSELQIGDVVFVSGYKNATTFTFRDLDLNPANNSAMIDGTATFYCTPLEVLSNEIGRAIHYFITDRDGRIVRWSDERLDALVDAGTLDPTPAQDATTKLLTELPYELIIGSISIDRKLHPQELLTVDVRNRERLQEQTERDIEAHLYANPELRWLSRNSLSSRALPLMGASLIEVPFAILEDAGGEWTREQVEEVVRTKAAAGTHQVIRYYGDYVALKAAEIKDDRLRLIWSETLEMDDYVAVIEGERGERRVEIPLEKAASDWAGHYEGEVDLVVTAISAIAPLIIHIEPALNGYSYPWSNYLRLDVDDITSMAQCSISASFMSRPSSTVTMSAALELQDA